MDCSKCYSSVHHTSRWMPQNPYPYRYPNPNTHKVTVIQKLGNSSSSQLLSEASSGGFGGQTDPLTPNSIIYATHTDMPLRLASIEGALGGGHCLTCLGPRLIVRVSVLSGKIKGNSSDGGRGVMSWLGSPPGHRMSSFITKHSPLKRAPP